MRQVTGERAGFWGDRLVAAPLLMGALLAVAAVAVVAYTRRPELGAVMALPLGLLLVGNFRFAATMTIWFALIWVLRIPAVYFDLIQFSYVVYASIIITLAAYVVRLGIGGQRRLPLITNKWIWLFIATIAIGGIHGAQNVGDIPPWLLANSDIDLGVPWTYYRTVVFPGILLPLLAIFVAAALADHENLSAISRPIWTLVFVIDALIIGQVVTSGEALSLMATQRSEHLTSIGFHSNELGAFLAIAYGLGLGVWDGAEKGRSRTALGALLAVTAVALLLTFSRGAYLAFAVVTVVVFMRGAPKKRAAFLCLALALWFAAPTVLVDRIGYGMTSKDANEISAGRVENIWMPLLLDVGDHVWVGQGLHSIMWTDAQRFQEIFPVNIAHNGFLDLVLDFGLVGALPVFAWYGYLWHGFRRGASQDSDPQFRAMFFGGNLALTSFFLCALTNNRLTPTAPTCVIWIVGGLLIGRSLQQSQRRDSAAPKTSQRQWRPLVGVPGVPSRVAAFHEG